MSRYEIRFAGSGGQGIILAAVIAGEAAALYEENLYVVQTYRLSKSNKTKSAGDLDPAGL